MKAFTTILILSFLSLSPFIQHTKAPEPLSDAELQQIRDRLPCLYPGMTVKEAFDFLGVNVPARNVGLRASGPFDDYRLIYQLAEASNEHGYNLLVVTDKYGLFKRAEIACWRDHPRCQEDNQKAKENPKECPTPTPAPNKSLHASRVSGLLIDSLRVSQLRAAA